MLRLPLLVRPPEKRNVQDVGLVRINDAHLRARHCRRNQVLLNGIRVNPVVDLRQLTLHGPPELSLFCRLETLKLSYEIQLELNGNPRRKLKCNITVGE